MDLVLDLKCLGVRIQLLQRLRGVSDMDPQTIRYKRDEETGMIAVIFGAELSAEAALFLRHLATFYEEANNRAGPTEKIQQTDDLWRFAATLEGEAAAPNVDRQIRDRYCPWVKKGILK